MKASGRLSVAVVAIFGCTHFGARSALAGGERLSFEYPTAYQEADAGDKGPPTYVRFGVGTVSWNDSPLRNLDPGDYQMAFDEQGGFASAALGVRLSYPSDDGEPSAFGLRLEAEVVLGYVQYDLLDIETAEPQGDGDFFEYGGALNVLPEWRIGAGVAVFAGGGVGISYFQFNNSFGEDLHASNDTFVLQAIGGLSWDIDESISVYAMYRYRSYGDVRWRDGSFMTNLEGLTGSAIEVGVMFAF